jgi:threonine aldolase
MAARLASALDATPGVRITQPVQSNAVFAALPDGALAEMHRRFVFHTWDASIGEARWMCSWDTTEEDVDALADAVLDIIEHPRGSGAVADFARQDPPARRLTAAPRPPGPLPSIDFAQPPNGMRPGQRT